MGGRSVSPERLQVLLGCLAAGMNPLQASRAAGVSKSLAYELDREASGGASRLAARRAGMAARAEARAKAAGRRAGRERAVLDALAGGMNPLAAARAAGVSSGRRVEELRLRAERQDGRGVPSAWLVL
jgi:hypothetical protein